MLSRLWPKKIINVVTHNGNFHPDEVFACATILIWAQKTKNRIRITRSRDGKTIEKADLVIDVGGIYDEKIGRFDHHQRGGAGARKDKSGLHIPYASFGLVVVDPFL
jgi:uncharacterized UPF0160 family protein